MRKGFYGVFFVLLFAFSYLAVVSFYPRVLAQNGSLPDFSGIGGPLDITEYAVGDYGERTVEATTSWSQLPETVITPGYNAVEITLHFFTGFSIENWTVNENFTIPDPTNSSLPVNWTAYEFNNETGGKNEVDFTAAYDNITDTVEVTAKGTGLSVEDAIGDYGAWRQLVNITSGGIVGAKVILNFSRDYQSQNPNNARLFVDVGNQRVEIARFEDPNDSPTPNWHIFEVDLDSELLNSSLPGLLNLSLGVEYRGGKLAQQVTAYFSYVSLILTVPAVGSEYDLKIRDILEPTQNYSVPESGIVSIEGNWSNQIEIEIWSNSSVSVNFDTTVEAVSNKSINLNFQTSPDSDVNWTGIFDAIHPYYPYDYKYFNISLPLDWNVSSVLDPLLKEQLGLNVTVVSSPSGKTIIIDAEHAGKDMGLTEALFGEWQIFGDSPNYALEVFTQTSEGTGWVNGSEVHLSDLFRVIFIINSSHLALNAGKAILTVYDPQQSIFAQQTIVPNASGIIQFDDISFNLTSSSAGDYSIDVGWVGKAEVANTRTQSILIRPATFEVIHPVGSEASVYEGSSFMISVRLVDNYTAEAVTGMQVLYQLSWENESIWHPMDASDECYVGTVTISTAVSAGSYLIAIKIGNQTLDYEAANLGIDINVEGLPQSGWLFLDWITLPIVVAAVGGAGGYILWGHYLKYPPIVRKIRKLRSKIRKGRTPSEPIDVKSTQDLIRGLQAQYNEPIGQVLVSPIRSEELSVITVEMPPEESLIEASEAAAKEVSPTRKRTTTKKRTSKRGQKKTEPGTRKRKRKQKRKTKNTR
ncbi:MAG: hypothetical protein ACFE7S_05870 [Candidatus Hodarchaeota archaeon]